MGLPISAPRSHWVKIDRALDHINALDESIKEWRSKDPYSITEERNPQPNVARGTRVSLILHVASPYRPEWSAFIGDTVHNLRSSLDHLVHALNRKGYAEANQGAELPVAEVKRSEFPIIGNVDAQGNPADGATEFLKPHIQRKIAYVPDAAKHIIDGVQPYKRGDKFEEDAFWLIHNLDVIDKHRQLVIASTAPSQVFLRYTRAKSVDEGYNMGPLNDGDELAYWVVPSFAAEVEYDLNFAFGIAFGEGTYLAGRPVVDSLRKLHDWVRVGAAAQLDALL